MQPKTKISISIISSLLLIVVLSYSLPAQQNTADSMERFWINKTHQSSNSNILIGGDSRIYRGVSANEIVKTIGEPLKAINLGYSSAGFSPEYLDFVVENLDNSSSTKIIILGITPHSLTKEAFLNKHFHQFKNQSKTEVFKKLYLSKVTDVFSSLTIDQIINDKESNYYQRYENDGWVASNKNNGQLSETIKSYTNTFSKYQVSQEHLELFYQKIKEIKEEGIQIIAFRPPTANELSDLENEISGFNEKEVKQQLNKIGVHWITLKNEDYLSYDGSHLHYDSALKLSQLLGQKIKGAL